MANDGGSGKSTEPAEATGPTEATNLREMMRLVAQLYYVRELGQPEIAALTGFSISKVSRLLSAARAAGVVRIAVEGVPTAPTPIARALSAALDVEVWVTPGHETAPVLAARLCAVAAAPRLLDELPQEGAIGLTGGYTVESLVNALPAGSLPAGSLPARSGPSGSHPRVVVVPLVGGWDSSNPHLTSNEIARHMAARIGAGVRL